MQTPPSHDAKLNPALIAKLSARPNEQHPVTVTFNAPQSADAVTALGLSGDGTTAYGDLDRAGVLALAALAEVTAIAYRPPHFLR